jgi:hypothetical protein
MAKPMKPSTGEAARSHSSTFSVEAPRPSSTQVTPSRPSPVRACSASMAASDCSSTPSIFHTSTSMPNFWQFSMARRMSSGRSSAS